MTTHLANCIGLSGLFIALRAGGVPALEEMPRHRTKGEKGRETHMVVVVRITVHSKPFGAFKTSAAAATCSVALSLLGLGLLPSRSGLREAQVIVR